MLKSYCEERDLTPHSVITKETDCRDPMVREEVFMKFYEYHLSLKAHPGCVYGLIPYLAERFLWDSERTLWFVYLLGCTQNAMTAWMVFREFPEFDKINLGDMETWHRENWRSLAYDTDRRYQKGHLVTMVTNYKKVIEERSKVIGGNNQLSFFMNLDTKNPQDEFANFNATWDMVKKNFHMFGRLSTFSYLEYLRIAGLPINCSSLFLEDMSGSLSHRNGILKVYGLDHLEQHKKINPNVKHNKEIVEFTKVKGSELLTKAKFRFRDKSFSRDVNYFTLESTLCCYKSWFRENRRYPNVYIDMFNERLLKAEELGIGDDLQIFIDFKETCLPSYANSGRITKKKQNHFRETGEVLYLGNMFPNNFKKGLENEI